ncbi:MAG: hypothetical protein LBH53_03625 [Puniceicoccales bacterium]|nr:hypothetical protein [Puniceicoccales bacterium]
MERHSPDGSVTRKLVPLLLSVFFVTVAVLFGIFRVRSHIRQSQNRRFVEEVLLLQESLNQYAYQAEPAEPTYPAIGKKLQKKPPRSPIDGRWKIRHFYDSKDQPVTNLVVEHPNRTMREMERLDAAIDDGDLATGHFRMIAPDVYALQILSGNPAGNEKQKPQTDGPATAR